MTEDVKADAPKKLSIQRRTKTTVSSTTTGGKSKEVQVEVRKKRTVKTDIAQQEEAKLKAQQEIEEAQKQSEGQSEIVTEQATDGTSNQNQVFVETAAPRMTPEEEKEAYEALERVRARILKEDEERAELLKAAAEQQVQ